MFSSVTIRCGRNNNQLLTLAAALILGVLASFLGKLFMEPPIAVVEETKIAKHHNPLKYWGVCIDQWNQYGNLRTMNRVFERLDYEFVNASNGDDWDVLWAIEFYDQWSKPEIFDPVFKPLKPHQLINHIPGMNYIASKKFMNTNNQEFAFILRSFDFPDMITEFQAYRAENSGKKFIEKNFDNRGVKVVDIEDINFDSSEKFYQEFMDKPLLIDDRTFDLGIFVLISSIDPLRIYRYNQEVLLRFCPEPYYPFDAANIEKYVVYETHKHFFEMPSLNFYFDKFGFSFKLAFEDHLQRRGHDVELLQQRIDDAIVKLVLKNEHYFIQEVFRDHNSSRNFFELVRFDFLLDEDLNLFLMEVNKSPNLTPMYVKFERNSFSNEQLVYQALRLVGAASRSDLMSCYNPKTEEMLSNSKNIAVNPSTCVDNNCFNNCNKDECQLCTPCVSEENLQNMHRAFREHARRGDFKRIFPTRNHFVEDFTRQLSVNNQISARWFKTKCDNNQKWC